MFFDDSQSKVDAANAAGVSGYLFTGIESVKYTTSERSGVLSLAWS